MSQSLRYNASNGRPLGGVVLRGRYEETKVHMKRKRYSIKNDPHAIREAERYEDPIPSRELILAFIDESDSALSIKEIAKGLSLKRSEQQEALRRRLRAMDRDRQIFCDRKGRYTVSPDVEMISGKVKPTREGRLFVNNDGEKVFLTHREKRACFPGDEVQLRIIGFDRSGNCEGEIESIVARNTRRVVGRLCEDYDGLYVAPNQASISQDIVILQTSHGCQVGDIVEVEIVAQPTVKTQPVGEVLRVVGDEHSLDLAIDAAISAHSIRNEWPDAVALEIQQVPKRVTAKDRKGRKDCRDLPFVTIDGEDAKDFDDAVYAEKRKGGGWTLYVAIADVSYYVESGSALDAEALKRGNSVYFPQHVVPMLPEVLSNGLCSLKPKVDRLALVCQMQVSKAGNLTHYEFYPAVIHSHARLTYTEVGGMLDGTNLKAIRQHESIYAQLETLYRLYEALAHQRRKRGTLAFDTVEVAFEFDKRKCVKGVRPVVRNDAHRLIEECMLLANIAAAKYLIKSDLPGVFRIHDAPDADKFADFKNFLSLAGVKWPTRGTLTTKQLSELVERATAKVDPMILQTMVLKSLYQAVYSTENNGHFGLGFEAYSHFTSPIRRYADLLVHRLIRFAMDAQDPNGMSYPEEDLAHACRLISGLERQADEASREVDGYLKCAYMHRFVGDVFDGVVTGVTCFGLFVQLDGLYMDGLVHVTALKNDYYEFDAVRHVLVGERTRREYRLGQSVVVRIAAVSVSDRKCDLVLVSR